jgi:putative sigma-54 modulation protein
VRTIVKGKNLEVPDRVRQYAERKFARLERLLDDRSDAILELSNESHRSAADAHIADVTLVIDGKTLKSHATARPTRRRSMSSWTRSSGRRWTSKRSRGSGPEKTLLRTITTAPRTRAARGRSSHKRFAIEPMFEEDAVSRMEELGHSFFVFVNAENERVAVLYRRRDGDYGLIEPTVGGGYSAGRSSNDGTGQRR